MTHPDGTEQQFVGIEVIHNRTVSYRNGATDSTVNNWSTPPRKPLIGTYTEALWESGEYRTIAHYDVYGLMAGAEVPPPAELEIPRLPEISPVPDSPSFQVPVLDWPEIGTPAGDRLVYHNSDEGPKLARLGELPPGTFYWVDPPAPATPPTPEEIENAVVTFADRSGNVATTTIAQGPLRGVWFFYWVQDARIRLPANWFDGADITWDHTLQPPLPSALPPA